jgi:hypothetical protein
MEWTAYRMSIVYFIHGTLVQQEDRGSLALHAIASRGDPKVVNKMIAGKKG